MHAERDIPYLADSMSSLETSLGHESISPNRLDDSHSTPNIYLLLRALFPNRPRMNRHHAEHGIQSNSH